MKKYLCGVDIGGTSIKIGLFDIDFNLLERFSIPTNLENHGSQILSEIAFAIQEKTSFDDIIGIGFGVPGPVFRDIIQKSVNLGWERVDLKKEFYAIIKRDDIVIHVSNDANTAAFGEYKHGVAKGHTNVAMMTIGTGIGGGIVIHGHIVDGVNGVAGEIGHMIVDHKYDFLCNCGKIGCLETVASATGIIRVANYKLKNSNLDSALRNYHHGFSAKKVIDFAKEGDLLSTQVMNEVADYIATMFANITYTINPDIFVIGGGVSLAGDYLLSLIEEKYYPYALPFVTKTNIKLSTLGNDAGIYGAASLVKP
ncbi:MAG: ROK family glucokinase [Firmicutes bacterium]|nr:ROK family glucokinase [Bacillota bacterium]